MQLPITLTLRTSRWLAWLLMAAHGCVLALLAAIDLSLWIELALLLGILWSAWRNLSRIQGRQRIVRLTLRRDGLLEGVRSNGEVVEARIHPHTTVTAQLTVMLMRAKGKIEALVLLPDALAAEDYRKLRLWLRWRAEVG